MNSERSVQFWWLGERNFDDIDVQEAFKKRRLDFILRCEKRRRAIQEMAHLRPLEKAKCDAIRCLFTHQQLRQQTENIYQKLYNAKNNQLIEKNRKKNQR